METGDLADAISTVDHSNDSNLSKIDPVKAIVVDGNDPNENNTESNKSTSPVNVQDNENNADVDDDYEVSVIIDNIPNKTIELHEDSEEESDLHLADRTEDLSNPTKSTEFVVVNAADLTTNEGEETETRNKYDDIHIKDELAETITADPNTNDVLENDPMDLLELNNRSESSLSVRSQEETDYADDVSSIGSSSIQTGSSSTISVHDWIKEYPWLLYDEGEEPFGYCLYCDAKINTKSQRSAKQHGLSLYHKERCENYLAFREEEEKNGLGMKLVEIKEEFGTDSRVEALKLKRKSQSAALNNFNWRRWLEDCPWLERDSPEGTIGYCKYCRVHVNVEFSYLRDRHQEGSKHREAEKQHEESNEPEDNSKQSDVNDEKDKDSSTENSQPKSQKWLEFVKNEPTMVRCKICGHKMFKNNFLRHLRTNLHEQNERAYLESQKPTKEKESDNETVINEPMWKIYSKNHPWLVSDPKDSTFAFCKYCEKRIVYGGSVAKRTLHENSLQHKQYEVEYKKKHEENEKEDNNAQNDNEEEAQRKDGEEEDDADQREENEEDEEDGADEEDNEGENEDDKDDDDDNEEEEEDNEKEDRQEGKEGQDDNESKKRVYKLSDEWLNQYSWCKRYKKDPLNFIFCIYCRIPLSASYSRAKHQVTSFHISAEKKFLSRQAKKQKLNERKESNENAPFYEWAIHFKNNPSNYSCRYCRVRISKNYSKKQHASSKIHQINENIYKNSRRKSLRSDENTNTTIPQQTPKSDTQVLNTATTKKLQTYSKVVIKAPSTVTLIKQYQKKFPWLSYKRSELRSHYGHCKLCDTSLYIRSLKHVLRHTRSGRHMSIIRSNKKQKVEKDEVDEDEKSSKTMKKTSKEELETSPEENKSKQTNASTVEAAASHGSESQKAFNYKSTVTEMKKRFSWIEQSEKLNYAFCRFCNTNIPLKILFLKNHSNSHKHRRCVIEYYSFDDRKATRQTYGKNSDSNDDSKCGDLENDVVVLEDNNEEILISEQDENWTVKSETMDEHEELDYLLQRSVNSTHNATNIQQRNIRKNANAEDEPPPKRIRRSQSFRRLNDNSSLVASLLTTPLTLASCLGPLIQQQIQQQASLSQISLAKCNASAMPETGPRSSCNISATDSDNTYDLFFKSISATMKKLPVDLAAEGKLRVMQIICDLELQALKRQQSERNESVSSNTSSGLNNQATSTCNSTLPLCSSSAINDLSTEQNGNVNSNETIITQLNMNPDVPPCTTTNILPPIVTNLSGVEKAPKSSATSPIIGVMDKNGLQTLQFKSSAPKQVPRNPTTTTATSVTYSAGIRCIPFKNLSQPATTEPSNSKITRIQVPIPQNTKPNPNANANLINFRNIQITKRITTPPASAAPATGPQQNVQKTSAMTSKSPQRTFITNIQPQLQRWGCSVNGAPSHHAPPTSSAVNHLQQLSSQQTSTPISKK